MSPLPHRRMSRTDPIFLPPIVVDDSDDDANMADANAATSSGFSLEFVEQPPPDSPMDWTPAAQPSTGEISAAQPSGEISSDDEDFAVDEDFRNASANEIEGVLRMWTQSVMSQSMKNFSISLLFETSFVLCIVRVRLAVGHQRARACGTGC